MFHLEKLKDSSCAHEYAVAISNRFEVLDALEQRFSKWGLRTHRGLWHFDSGSVKSGAKLVVYAADFRESHLATLVECHCVNHRQCTSSSRQERMYHESLGKKKS